MNLPNPVNYRTYTGQPLPIPKLYDYITHRGGVVKLGWSPYFQAAIPVSNGADIAGLPDYPAGVELFVPRIPARWLSAVLGHARQARQAGQGRIEQMYFFHWLDGEWRVEIPAQEAGAVRVAYSGGDAPSIVLDLHSHHGMSAHFSTIDDADEQGLRFYAVIGRIFSRPEITVRVGVYGDWLPLDPTELFTGLGPFVMAKE